MTDFCYTILMPTPNLKTTGIAIVALLVLLIPSTAFMYFSPEEVLLNEDYFLPPAPRETKARQKRQQDLMDQNRTMDQQNSFDEQHPAPAEDSSEASSEAASSSSSMSLPEGLSQEDFDLLQQIHLLERRRTERMLHFGSATDGSDSETEQTHQGAPLPPTGAGMWLAASVMLGSILWTMRRARRADRDVL